MKQPIVLGSLAVLASFALAFAGRTALAQGAQRLVQTYKSAGMHASPPYWQLNVHYYGVGVRVANPNDDPAFGRRIAIVDLPPPVTNLREDRVPVRAQALVNGHVLDLAFDADGVLGCTLPSAWLDGLGPNDAEVQVWDGDDVLLARFDLAGCTFL